MFNEIFNYGRCSGQWEQKIKLWTKKISVAVRRKLFQGIAHINVLGRLSKTTVTQIRMTCNPRMLE
jgi:hypothetical protein